METKKRHEINQPSEDYNKNDKKVITQTFTTKPTVLINDKGLAVPVSKDIGNFYF
jgi:hypothetical protein